ncbi:MAG: glycerophosphodiester phosphodiesterase [Gammaproteobacteria bacterium]|nr:glycerophosphodiester phosphodiesterase [Gammaproteobacteria bacterium]
MARYVTDFAADTRLLDHEVRRVLVIGHRGAAGDYDENTLAAFRHAAACGVDGIEFDVRQLDDALIVLHDDTLERTTDGHGHYKAQSLAALRALRTPRGEQIPLLHEVLETMPAGLVNVEVKEAGIAPAVLAALRAWLATRPQRAADLLLSSFDGPTTTALADGRGGAMRLGVLYAREEGFDAALARARALGAWSLHLPLADVDAAAIARVHGDGLRALVYTVNAERDLARCHASGVDGVFSDFPVRALASVRRLARRDVS